MSSSRICDLPCWTKHDGASAGVIIDHGYGVHGFRVLVVTEDGELVDHPNANITLRERGRERPEPFKMPPPVPQPAIEPLGTGTGGGPLSKPPKLG